MEEEEKYTMMMIIMEQVRDCLMAYVVCEPKANKIQKEKKLWTELIFNIFYFSKEIHMKTAKVSVDFILILW